MNRNEAIEIACKSFESDWDRLDDALKPVYRRAIGRVYDALIAAGVIPVEGTVASDPMCVCGHPQHDHEADDKYCYNCVCTSFSAAPTGEETP